MAPPTKPAAKSPAKPSAAKPAKKVPTVPETQLKKTKTRAALRVRKLALAINKVKKAKALRLATFKRAEKHMLEYRRHKNTYAANKKEAKKNGNFYVADEPRVAFVMRIRGVNQVAPKVRAVLKLFRLLQINNGVFVKLNNATLQMLRIAEPYICWGYPSMKSIHDLCYKRGFGKIDGRRVALNDNSLIQKQLTRHGMICIDDIINEIYKCGPKFKQASNFLWPFKMNNPNGGWNKKKTHFVEGGDFGNREDQINKLIVRML
jgi:large subunit ribosomal protein L7e